MIDKAKLKEDFEAFCEEHGFGSGHVKIEEYNFWGRDEFFETRDHIWEEITEGEESYQNQENLEFDFDGWFHSDYPDVPEGFPITEELYNLMHDGDEDYITDEKLWFDQRTDDPEDPEEANPNYLEFLWEDKTYKDLPPDLQSDVSTWWSDLTVDEINDETFLKDTIEECCGISFEEKYNEFGAMEALAYWTIYFYPRIDSYDSAWKSNLFPFKYEDKFLLALGGCGMDLSPLLDCYQALVNQSIDENSMIFRDSSYFDHVSPVKKEEILKMIKRDVPRIILETTGPKEEEEPVPTT